MVILEKLNIIGEVPLLSKPDGEVIGIARVEKLRSGGLMFHSELYPEYRHVIELGGIGFKIGDFSIAEDS